jgi:PAS domain S-box-containing protein
MSDEMTAGVETVPHILLVEDNPLHIRLVNSMLDEVWPGYDNMAQARRLDSALEYLDQRSPDVVLLDLVLPDADGIEAVKAVLAAAPGVPVVVLSSHDDDVFAVEALREGAQDYLVKGTIGPAELVRAIRFAMVRRPTENGGVAEELIHMAAPADDGAALPTGVSVGFAVLDRTGAVRFAAIEVAEMMGRRLSELVGHPLVDVTHGDDLQLWRDAFARLAADPTADPTVDVRILHSGGHEVRVHVELTPLEGAAGTVEAFLADYIPSLEEGTGTSGGTYVVMTGWSA